MAYLIETNANWIGIAVNVLMRLLPLRGRQ